MFNPDHPGADGKVWSDTLGGLLAWLRRNRYVFVTPTPATHGRVLARGSGRGDLRDAFGWNRSFDSAIVEPELLRQLLACGLVEARGHQLVSRIRVSALDGVLFAHSAFPTDDRDAVFFGPDSYRFAALIEQELADCPTRAEARLVDIGTGAGVGGIVAARCCPALSLTLTDVNARALAFARVNAAAAGVEAAFVCSSTLDDVTGEFDVVLANPPYIVDAGGRAYRDGGDLHGAAVALGMAEAATARLARGGRLILYTGSAIIDGIDPLRERLAEVARAGGCTMRYREIDPDVFGEELETDAYADVDRIALVAAIVTRV